MNRTRQTVIWTQSLDHSTYKASAHGALLTVTRKALDEWAPTVEWLTDDPVTGPTMKTRAAAQRWCERRAGEGP